MRPETRSFEQRKVDCRAVQGDGGSALHGPSIFKSQGGSEGHRTWDQLVHGFPTV